MTQVDSNIALQVKTPEIQDPLQAVYKAQTLRNAMQQNERGGLELQQLRTHLGEEEGVKARLMQPDAWDIDKEGNRTLKPQTLNDLWGISPKIAQGMQTAQSEQRLKNADYGLKVASTKYKVIEGEYKQNKMLIERADAAHAMATDVLGMYNANVQQPGADEPTVRAQATQAMHARAQEMFSNGQISAEQNAALQKAEFDPAQAQQFVGQKERIDQQKVDLQKQHNADLRKHYDEEAEHWKNSGKANPHFYSNREGLWAIETDANGQRITTQIKDAQGRNLDGKPLPFAQVKFDDEIQEARRWITDHPPTVVGKDGKVTDSKDTVRDPRYHDIWRKAQTKMTTRDDPEWDTWSRDRDVGKLGNTPGSGAATPAKPPEGYGKRSDAQPGDKVPVPGGASETGIPVSEPKAPAKAKTPAPAPKHKGASAPPPQVVGKLKEGKVSRFDSGETWLQHDGKAYQLEEGEDTMLDNGAIVTMQNGKAVVIQEADDDGEEQE